LIVPGTHTDSLLFSSAACHKVLLFPHPLQSFNITHYIYRDSTTISFPRSTRSSCGVLNPPLSMHQSTTLCPPFTLTTMPPRWKSDARRRPPRFAYLRSCLPLLVLLILFSFLLSSVALLSHFRSPAAKQQLGWQAWDVVEMHYAKPEDEDTAVFAPSIPLEYWVSC
jgi:hypothetical protein